MADELTETAQDISVAKTGKDLPEAQELTLLERANKAKEDNEKILTMMSEERQKMEKLMSDIALSGRSLAGRTVEKTEEQKVQEEADKYLRVLGIKK